LHFIINKTFLRISGEDKSKGDIVSAEELGKMWKPLLASGKIRRVSQSSRSAYRHGERFKRPSKVYTAVVHNLAGESSQDSRTEGDLTIPE